MLTYGEWLHYLGPLGCQKSRNDLKIHARWTDLGFEVVGGLEAKESEIIPLGLFKQHVTHTQSTVTTAHRTEKVRHFSL